jgi:hypothetical protein
VLCILQANEVVRGAALLFQRLESVSLRRVSNLRDDALVSLAFSCGAYLQVDAPPLSVLSHSARAAAIEGTFKRAALVIFSVPMAKSVVMPDVPLFSEVVKTF